MRVLDHEIEVWGSAPTGQANRVARVVFTTLGTTPHTFIFDRGRDNATIDGSPEFDVVGHVDDHAVCAIVRAYHDGYEQGRRQGRRDVAGQIVATFKALVATGLDGRPL